MTDVTGRKILFTDVHKAELLLGTIPAPGKEEVRVRMEYTVVSGGTERANLLNLPNTVNTYPRALGYCGIGRVDALGENVGGLTLGQRVLVYHGKHSDYSVVPKGKVTPVPDGLDPVQASFTVIAAMGLGGVRKLKPELGESALVIGQGLLGCFAAQFLRLSGLCPVITADLSPARRSLSLKLGADASLDPTAPDFKKEITSLTDGRGINACVEVTGASSALPLALSCAAPLGRISLLGCTRVSDCNIDFYTQVHRPGITLIGAHNFVRPKSDSYPGYWTHQDDCRAILSLMKAGRLLVEPMISRVVKPESAPEIYNELCDSPDFPMGTVFDWN